MKHNVVQALAHQSFSNEKIRSLKTIKKRIELSLVLQLCSLASTCSPSWCVTDFATEHVYLSLSLAFSSDSNESQVIVY